MLGASLTPSALLQVLLVATSWTLVLSYKFPNNWKKCPKKGNDECLRVAIEEVVNDLKNGNRALGMIPLNPLHINKLEVLLGLSSAIAGNLTFSDFDIIYNSELIATKVKIDWDKYKGELEFRVPGHAYMVGDYSVDGKVLVLPIQGKGKSNITFEDLTLSFKFNGREKIKDGKRYLHVDETQWITNPTRMYLWLENLFGGVPGLGDAMNKFLNDNWKIILDEMKGSISEAMGLAHKQIANSFFEKIPLDEIYTNN